MPNPDNSSLSDDDGKQILNHMLKHMVTFTGAFIIIPLKEQAFNFSGFLVSLSGKWYIMTAGHILNDLDPAIASGRLIFTGRVLADYYGEGAKHTLPIPFDYANHNRSHAWDKDLIDYALISLDFLEVEQLKANGRVPFSFDGGPQRPWEDYDGFAIVGFPSEDVSSDAANERSGPVSVIVRPGLAPVHHLATSPPGIPKPTASWFLGELLDKSEPASIVGMSGGPIVGFKKNGTDLEYWVVAIQSQWYDKPRVTLGCPILVALGHLQKAVGNGSVGP